MYIYIYIYIYVIICISILLFYFYSTLSIVLYGAVEHWMSGVLVSLGDNDMIITTRHSPDGGT